MENRRFEEVGTEEQNRCDAWKEREGRERGGATACLHMWLSNNCDTY